VLDLKTKNKQTKKTPKAEIKS